jgi:uncharacterized membrane protein YhdT
VAEASTKIKETIARTFRMDTLLPRIASQGKVEQGGIMKQENSNPEAITKTIIVLYLAFFAVWCAGAAAGEIWPGAEQPALWGVPAWFAVSCVLSFAGVSVVLVRAVRGWLQ